MLTKEIGLQMRRGNFPTPGVFLQRIRTERGFSQEEVARRLAITQSYWSKIENGKMEIRIREWFRFCRMMGIPPTFYGYFVPDISL